MEINFNRINNWLNENADKILKCSLQCPADEVSFKELEEIVGKNLPQDFKQLYLWHNGISDIENVGSLFYGMDFLPIEKIIEQHKADSDQTKIPLCKADSEIEIGGIYNPDWIRFAFDGSHTFLCLDLSPTDKGMMGQIIFIDDEYLIGLLVAKSTFDLVADFANDLENGFYHLVPDALDEGYHFLEPAVEIDLVNWDSSEKWCR